MQKSKNKKKNIRKKYTKKHTKKHSKKGGSAKINFGYTYLSINYAQLLAIPEPFLSTINHYIRSKDAECNCRALTINPCPPLTDNVPIINQNQELILILKYDIIVSINADASILAQNLDNILGHAILDYTLLPTRNTIGIFNICLEQPAKQGYGSVIFNIILTYLELTQPKNIVLWIGIVLSNVKFEEVLHIYTSFGFRLPVIYNTNPFGDTSIQIPPIVSLLKRVSDNIPDESTTITEFNKTLDMRHQYLYKQANPSLKCEILFKFDKSVILKSRLWSYLGLNVNNQQFSISAESSDPSLGRYREYSGSYKIYNSEIINSGPYINRVCYKLSFETMITSEINLNIGEQLTVNTPPSSYNYHVHPLGAYRFLNVLIATPSGPDIQYFLNSVIDKKTSMQFHTVITIEGIYIISLHMNAIENFDTLKLIIPGGVSSNRISTTYEYPTALRAFDWTNPSSFGNDPSIVAGYIYNYQTWFNQQNILLTGYELLELQFIPWKNLNKNTLFKVNVPSIFKQCFPHSDDYKALENIHGPLIPDLSR